MSLQTRLEAIVNAVGSDIKILRGSVTAASTATLTPAATAHQYNLTAQAVALTIGAPTGSPSDGQSLMIRIKDDGTARAITWDVIFRTVGVTLPTTTVVGKTLYVGCKWNLADSKWDVLAVGREA